jgi:coenzyme F420 biosynthesis associated uncharacterized protein
MTAVPCVDWQVATAAGRLLTPAGPDVSRTEAMAIVADLRACAARATDAVAAATELATPASADVLVVGRDSWVSAATAMASTMLGAIGQQPATSLAERVGSRLAGAQLGAAFGFVATRILGQFDPYSPVRRLLLVAPNIVTVERAMGAEPHGFRQWVCLHEETHRFQFGAAPWLAQYLLELMRQIFDDDGDEPAQPQPARSPAIRLLSATQAATLDRVTAVMSLLEGHADVMMDRAGVGLVPNLDRYRSAFEARRDAPGFAQLISRLLGLRAKREQYLHGATFCRAVIAEAGVSGLNVAFRSPATLPTPAELHRPEDWLLRVSERVG